MRRSGALSHTHLLSACLVAAGVGCSSAPSTPADAGIDAPSAPADAGAPVDAFSEPDAGCDVGTPPSPLPDVVGGFALDTVDGGSALPVPTGGDPVGLWVFERGTFYVPAGAAMMFDEDMSSVDGTAWLEVTDTEFMLDWRFVTTLVGTIAGTIVRESSTQIHASYTLDGATFVSTPICVQSAEPRPDAGMGGTAGLSFSQSGDSITVQSRLSGATGTITIVLEGTRRASR